MWECLRPVGAQAGSAARLVSSGSMRTIDIRTRRPRHVVCSAPRMFHRVTSIKQEREKMLRGKSDGCVPDADGEYPNVSRR